MRIPSLKVAIGIGTLVVASFGAGFVFGETTSRQPSSRKQFKETGKSPNPRAGLPAGKSTAKSAAKGPSKKAMPQRADVQFQRALDLAKNGNYVEASMLLYSMSRSREYADRGMHIKYILGLMLYEMKLYQTSAFQFVDVVRDGSSSYVRKALEKLSLAADTLNNDTLLNYALTKIELSEFPKNYHDMLYFRIGEIHRKRGALDEAAKSFAKVQPRSPFWSKGKYLEGLSYAQMGQLPEALKRFQELVDLRSEKSVTDINRNAGLMAIARLLYQQKNWEGAIDYYRQIPKDTEFWHDVIFEQSWAHLRAAQFRSVLSTLHSLHSPFYEDYYIPESVLLRSFVYLFICQYDEMEKTLEFFDKTYKPVQQALDQTLKSGSDARTYYEEIARVLENFADLRKNRAKRGRFRIPFMVARTIMREGDFQRTYNHIKTLLAERRKIQEMPPSWRKSGIGIYAEKAVTTRLEAARMAGGRQVQDHLRRFKAELEQLFEQHGFARYEMMKGRKEVLKKQIAGKGLIQTRVDDEAQRDFYIQNGFEYWPFEGEYWLDEIGNYHYVGVQSCE